MNKRQENILKALKEYRIQKQVFNSVEVMDRNLRYPINTDEGIQLKNVDYKDGIYNLPALQKGLTAESQKEPLIFFENLEENKSLNFPVYSMTLNDELKKFILQALKYVCKDVDRYIMNGIYFGNGAISATDSRRLLTKEVTALNDADYLLNWNSKNASLLKKMFDNSDDLNLTVYKNKATLENDEFLYIFPLIDGQFPNFKQIIPEESALENEFILPDLKTLKTINSLIAKDKRVLFKDDKIEFMNKDDETLTVFFQSSLDYEISFNVEFLIDAVDFTDRLKNKDITSPGAFFKDDQVILIMPMR